MSRRGSAAVAGPWPERAEAGRGPHPEGAADPGDRARAAEPLIEHIPVRQLRKIAEALSKTGGGRMIENGLTLATPT